MSVQKSWGSQPTLAQFLGGGRSYYVRRNPSVYINKSIVIPPRIPISKTLIYGQN